MNTQKSNKSTDQVMLAAIFTQNAIWNKFSRVVQLSAHIGFARAQCSANNREYYPQKNKEAKKRGDNTNKTFMSAS